MYMKLSVTLSRKDVLLSCPEGSKYEQVKDEREGRHVV